MDSVYKEREGGRGWAVGEGGELRCVILHIGHDQPLCVHWSAQTAIDSLLVRLRWSLTAV